MCLWRQRQSFELHSKLAQGVSQKYYLRMNLRIALTLLGSLPAKADLSPSRRISSCIRLTVTSGCRMLNLIWWQQEMTKVHMKREAS